MTYRNQLLSPILAIIGGFIGAALIGFLLKTGLYPMALMGAAVGCGGGLLLSGRNPINGVLCALICLVMSYATEWYYMPFAADQSLSFFLRNLGALPMVKHILIGIGVIIACVMGLGLRKPRATSDGEPSSES